MNRFSLTARTASAPSIRAPKHGREILLVVLLAAALSLADCATVPDAVNPPPLVPAAQ